MGFTHVDRHNLGTVSSRQYHLEMITLLMYVCRCCFSLGRNECFFFFLYIFFTLGLLQAVMRTSERGAVNGFMMYMSYM